MVAGVDDPNGVSSSAWAKWSRGWTSEENRHGDLLNRYLYLTGRVDMRAIEVSEKKPMAMSDTQAPPLPRHIEAKGGRSCFYPGWRETLRHGWRCWVLGCVAGDDPAPDHERLRPQGQEGPLQGPCLHLLPGREGWRTQPDRRRCSTGQTCMAHTPPGA